MNPARTGTKAAAHYRLTLAAGRDAPTVRLRLADAPPRGDPFGEEFDRPSRQRRRRGRRVLRDASIPTALSDDASASCARRSPACSGSKQFYHYDVRRWLEGDPGSPPPPPERRRGRNREWPHLYNDDVISMPDKWEYPWYAAWDLAFHCIPLALVDPEFAKEQLILFLREWYMHPNGQIPAYEWAFGDVNPPVHAWAAWRVYKIEKTRAREGATASSSSASSTSCCSISPGG